PVDLVKFGDRYWVVDGHNRVAAALYSGQAEIDAVVTELRLPGSPPSEEPGSLAPILAETAELRAVASGRWSGTVEPPASVTGLDGGSGAASAPSGSPESAGAGAASGAASAAGGSPETGPDAGSDAAARNEVRADRPSREPDGR
ncbi:MAG TPA: hypothetical protein VNJ28_06690, partial [Candidatus Limnocylindrales bacterium]|nr:hypothetical protein [Candidatus Limnocylindrales bacterium]